MISGFLVCILLVASIFIGVRYYRDMQAVRAQVASLNSQVIETPCGQIEYARAGSGQQVLVIHGISGGFDQGLGLANTLLGEGFQVITPSRFGYLRTPLPEHATVASQADAYACLLDALGVRQVAVVATSAGATSALQFAIRHPERVLALVLHSPNAPGKVEMKLPPRQVFETMFHSDFIFWGLTTYFAPTMRSLAGVPQGFRLSPEMETSVDQVLRSVLPSSERADGIVFDNYVSNPEINQYSFEKVAAPTLVMSAVDDPMALHENARHLAAMIPGARFTAVQNGGHLMLGHAEEVKTEISAFIQQAITPNGK